MMTLARCFTSPPYVRTELSSFSVRTTAAVFLHSWPHGGFTRRLRDFNALQGNLQFGTGTVYSANGMTKTSILINCRCALREQFVQSVCVNLVDEILVRKSRTAEQSEPALLSYKSGSVLFRRAVGLVHRPYSLPAASSTPHR